MDFTVEKVIRSCDPVNEIGELNRVYLLDQAVLGR